MTLLLYEVDLVQVLLRNRVFLLLLLLHLDLLLCLPLSEVPQLFVHLMTTKKVLHQTMASPPVYTISIGIVLIQVSECVVYSLPVVRLSLSSSSV